MGSHSHLQYTDESNFEYELEHGDEHDDNEDQDEFEGGQPGVKRKRITQACDGCNKKVSHGKRRRGDKGIIVDRKRNEWRNSVL